MLLLRKNCPEDIAELAELYLLDRLPFEDNRQVEEHLLSCSRCMQVLEETEQFLKAFRGAGERMNAEMAPAPVDAGPGQHLTSSQPSV